MTPAEFRRALIAMADAIIASEARLNALDAAAGDGDHGITMRLGFVAVKSRLAQIEENAGFDRLLMESAQAFMGVTGGAIGVILAKMLMGGATALRDIQVIGPAQFSAMLNGMEAAIAKAGKAKPGDKTILDAVHAAAEAAWDSKEELPQTLAAAATAADTAAAQTAEIVCRVGRASRLGDRTLGHPDPGAVSFSIMMRALAVVQRAGDGKGTSEL